MAARIDAVPAHAFAWIVVALASSGSCASPSISGVSGTLTHGSALTVFGTGFGVKASGTAAPTKFDDFEDGVAGTSVVSTGWWLAEEPYGNKTFDHVALAPRHARSKQHIWWHGYGSGAPEGSAAGTFGKGGLGFEATRKAFLDLWSYVDYVDGVPESGPDGSCQLKWIALLGDGPQPWGDPSWARHESNPSVLLYLWTRDFVHTSDFATHANEGYLGPVPGSPSFAPTERHWMNVQVLYKESSDYGKADGATHLYVSRTPATDGAYARLSRTAVSTRSVGDDGPVHGVSLGYYATNGFHEASTFWDDIYIDNSWARVELGDAPFYDSCRHREIQICSTWVDGTIRFRFNQGAFGNGPAYLFVVDEDNHASAGYPMEIGATVSTKDGIAKPIRNLSTKNVYSGQGKRLGTTGSATVELSAEGGAVVERSGRRGRSGTPSSNP